MRRFSHTRHQRPAVRDARQPRGAAIPRPAGSGQTLVEFALVLPLFLTVFLAIIEFAFAFNAILAINFASRNAALLAAEGGNEPGTDCIVLRSIENDVRGPADRSRITQVQVYEADRNGNMVGLATIYDRTGSTTCTYGGGTTITVPYTQVADGYPEASRCNELAGCDADHPRLDIVGVQISYHHDWVTPVRSFIGGDPGGFDFVRSNATRMEPVV